MTQHTDLIERLGTLAGWLDEEEWSASRDIALKAAEALEAQAREIEGLRKDSALVAAREREALLVEMRSGEVQLPMQVAARWPSVPGSHKYAGAGGCQPGSFGPDSEDLFTTAQLLDYGDRRAAAAIRALNTEGEGHDAAMAQKGGE